MHINEGFQGVSNCYVFKSQLQEYAQKAGISTPLYETIKEGPSHEPSFKSTVIVNDVRYDSLLGFSNRKLAEQSAAEVALRELSKSGDVNQSIAQPIHETGLCKNLLQEYAQKMNYAIPLYMCQKEENPGRVPLFSCTVDIGGTLYVGAAAKTKKEAEIKVARTALLAIQSSKSESSGQPANNSELTLLPSKKRRVESNTKCQETANVPKPKKARFKKRKLKRKLPGNDAGQTQVQNEGNSEVIGAGSETFGSGANPSVNPMEANLAVNPMEANPAVNPMEASPAVKPMEASPAVNLMEAYPSVNPMEANPSVNPMAANRSVNPMEANPAVNPAGANPSINPEGANPSVNPEGANPSVNPEGANPSVNPAGAKPSAYPAVNPTEGHPSVNPMEANPVGANPSVNPAGANPSVNPAVNSTEANLSVNPMEANAAVNPAGANPAVNPAGANPSGNLTEANPSANPMEANPAVDPAGANQSVNPTEANPSVNPMEANPAVNPAGANPSVNLTVGEAALDSQGWVPHVIQIEESQQSVCEPGVAPHVNDAATETGQPTGMVLNQSGNGAIDWAPGHCPLHM